MKYNRLGKTDLILSELGFGCSRIASLTTKYNHKEVAKTLQQAVDLGINFFDTADIYGQGDSERLLGKILSRHRESIFYCTKAGLTLSAPQNFIRYFKPILRPVISHLPLASKKTTAIRQQVERQCFQTHYIQQQIENSLRSLQTDYLDMFLLHNPPKDVINRTDLFEMLNKMKLKGLIRYFGVSCREHTDALICLQKEGVSCLQLNLNPLNIKASDGLLGKIHAAGVGLIARECLSNKNTSYQLWHHPPDQDSLNKFTASQLALQAVLKVAAANAALVGMGCRKHLLENLAVVN